MQPSNCPPEGASLPQMVATEPYHCGQGSDKQYPHDEFWKHDKDNQLKI